LSPGYRNSIPAIRLGQRLVGRRSCPSSNTSLTSMSLKHRGRVEVAGCSKQ
jgi:hypothetical protein